MTDTQWPRWVVLQQERENKPHQYDGSVHAPDAEMALLNARDVFVRRPECVSLWVVRAAHILALTAEEITEGKPPTFLDGSSVSEGSTDRADSYYVFQKIGHKGLHQHTGEVEAASPLQAMHKARAEFESKIGMVWWVFPISAVLKSTPEDIEAMFAIAETKIYRDQGQYHTVAALRKIKEQTEQERHA